jgi:hypothetical protein
MLVSLNRRLRRCLRLSAHQPAQMYLTGLDADGFRNQFHHRQRPSDRWILLLIAGL